MSEFFFDNEVFPDRKDLKKSLLNEKLMYDDIAEQAKKIELDKVNFANEDFVPKSKIVQKQAVFLWIRVYLKEDLDIQPNSDIFINYSPTGEKLQCKFICFAKKGLEKDHQDEVVNYTDEDDKRVLCLMVDEERINIHNEDIPFIKTLFKIGRYYQPNVFKRSDLTITNDSDEIIDYFDIDF